MAHLLFLSHAGADTERALRLAAAIEASPDAQKHGLRKHDRYMWRMKIGPVGCFQERA